MLVSPAGIQGAASEDSCAAQGKASISIFAQGWQRRDMLQVPLFFLASLSQETYTASLHQGLWLLKGQGYSPGGLNKSQVPQGIQTGDSLDSNSL